jgi:hypothetical protein
VSDTTIMLDLSELSGDATPASLANFLTDNAECPPDESEISALRALQVGNTTRLGIGGGFVTVRRVA